MTMLSASPWFHGVLSVAPALGAEVEARHPMLRGVVVSAVEGERLVTVAVGAVVGGDRTGAVWAVAREVSPLWVDLLAGAGVGLRVSVGALLVSADAELMAGVASGDVSLSVWRRRVVQSIGG